MGGLSMGHWLIVLVIVVLVFGTRRLTSGARDLGEAVREFKRGVGGDAAPRAITSADAKEATPASTVDARER